MKNKKIYIIVIAALFICRPCILPAQSQSEFTVSLGLGSSALKYQLDNGSSKSGFGVGFGAGYSYYFTRMIGVSLGLEVATFGSSADLGNLSFQQQIPTPAGLSGNFQLQANYTGLKETQSAVMVQIPVMLQFQFPMNEKNALFLGAGVKAGFPVSAKWSQSAAALTTTGYSDYTGQQYVDMPNHGFSTYSGISSSGKLELGSPVFLALEGGLKFGISKGVYLYTGVFLDYGLNDIYKAPANSKGASANMSLLEYNNASPADYSYNSVLTTNHYSAPDGIKPFAVGIKIKLGFGSGKAVQSNKSDKTNESKESTKPAKPVKEPVAKPQPVVKEPEVKPQPAVKEPEVKPQPVTKEPVVKPQPVVKEPVKKPEKPKPQKTIQKVISIED